MKKQEIKQAIDNHLEENLSYQSWIKNSIEYLTIMGSRAYGVHNEDSDIDVYGMCIPPKEVAFNNLFVIQGFDKNITRFDQCEIKTEYDGKEVDVAIYSMPKYFRLLMDNNPNILDSLFTDKEDKIFRTEIFDLLYTNRNSFLSKRCFRTHLGYAKSQLKKLKNKNREGKRKGIIEKHGYDVKFAYHLIRLVKQCFNILMFQDLNLKKENSLLKNIRAGIFLEEEIYQMFDSECKKLENAIELSRIRENPDESFIRFLLCGLLEEKYGSLEIKTSIRNRVIY